MLYPAHSYAPVKDHFRFIVYDLLSLFEIHPQQYGHKTGSNLKFSKSVKRE